MKPVRGLGLLKTKAGRITLTAIPVALTLVTAGWFFLFAANAPDEPTKFVALYVTDLPGGLEKLRVNILAATVGAQEAPLRVEESVVELSLLHGPGESLRIASGNVPPEAGGRVSLVFGGAEGFREGAWFPIVVPQNRLTVEHALVQGTFDRNAVLFDFNLNTSLAVQDSGDVLFQPYIQTAYEYHYENYTEIHPDGDEDRSTGDDDIDWDFDVNWSLALDVAPIIKVDLPPQFIDSLAKEIVHGLCERMPGCVNPTGVLKECLDRLTCPTTPRTCFPVTRCVASTDQVCPEGEDCTGPEPANNRPPLTPSNPSPILGQVRVSLDPVLSWVSGDPDGHPLLYDVVVERGGECLKTTSTSCQIRGLAPGTEYRWTVTATDGFSQSVGGPWTFTTLSKDETPLPNRAPFTPTGPSPASGTPNQPLALTLRWSGGDPDAEAVEFLVLLDETANPSKIVCEWQPVSTCSVTGLAAGKTFKWKVVARDAAGLDAAGPIWSFDAATASAGTQTPQPANNPPKIPSSPSPASGTSGIALNPTISWSGGDPDGDEVQYQVTVNGQIKCAGRALSCALTGLAPDTAYTWSVTATDVPMTGTGASRSGPTWTFTAAGQTTPANSAPSAPTGASPISGASDQSATATTLAWSASDPDGDALQFQVFFGLDAQPTGVACAWSPATTCVPSSMVGGTTYYWRVDARDGKGGEVAGPVWSFLTQNRAPNAPGSPSPANGVTTVAPNQNEDLTWTGSDPDGQAVVYRVYVSTQTNPTALRCDWSSSTTCQTGPLAATTMYYWKVEAKDSAGLISVGPVWNFKTTSTLGEQPNPTQLPDVCTPPHC